MRYSEMNPSERERILGNPDNYPLKVTFLGNTSLLNFAAIDLPRSQGVDFDVDDEQARRLLAGGRNHGGDGRRPRRSACCPGRATIRAAVAAALGLSGRHQRPRHPQTLPAQAVGSEADHVSPSFVTLPPNERISLGMPAAL